jgi:hypothetical protein
VIGWVLLCCLNRVIIRNFVVWLKRTNALQPWDNVGQVKDGSCSVSVAGTDRVRERLKRQRAAIKGGDGSWVKTLWLAGAIRV